MAMIAFSNSVKLLWPQGLLIVVPALYLVDMKFLDLNAAISSSGVRLLSFVGFLSTASVVLLGSMPGLYTIIAIPVIPAPFNFGLLVFRPNLIANWTRLRVYLTVCVVMSALAWTIQFIW